MVTTRSAKAASIASPTPSKSKAGLPPKSPHSKKAASVASGVSSKKSGSRKKAPVSVIVKESTALDFEDEDDFEYSDTDSIAVASAKSTKSNHSTTSSKRTKLPRNVEKALLSDIIERGGRKYFGAGFSQGLCALLDAPHRQRLYGARGSELRKRIGPRVQYLKNLPEEKWKRLIGPQGYDIKVPKASVKKEFPSVVDQADLSAVSDLDEDGSESEALPDKVDSAPDIVPSAVPSAVPSVVPSAVPTAELRDSQSNTDKKQASTASLLSRGYSSSTIKKTSPNNMSSKFALTSSFIVIHWFL